MTSFSGTNANTVNMQQLSSQIWHLSTKSHIAVERIFEDYSSEKNLRIYINNNVFLN